MQFLVAAVIFCTPPVLASAAGITDYSSHRPPAVTLPVAGGSYIDPVFGTKIIRVTDKNSGANCMHSYSYWPAFNHDDNRLMILCDSHVLLYKFDTATDKLTPDGTLVGADGYHVQFDGATWSYSSPDILFAVDQQGMRLWKIDVSKRGKQGYTMLKDFTGILPAGTYISQLSTDVAGRTFSFHTRNLATDKHLQPVVWDRTTNKTYLFPVKSTYVLDESFIDKNGKYAFVAVTNGSNTSALWDFRAGTTSWFSQDSRNDNVGGHYDLGADFMVNSDIYNAGIVGRTYSDLRPPDSLVRYIRPNGTANWTLCDHVSIRATIEDFFIGSTYLGDGTYGAFEKEIFLGFLDGHGFVRLGHTRSAGNTGYWSQPRASLDMKGRYIVYTSDLGTNRTDVMILKIPSQYWP